MDAPDAERAASSSSSSSSASASPSSSFLPVVLDGFGKHLARKRSSSNKMNSNKRRSIRSRSRSSSGANAPPVSIMTHVPTDETPRRRTEHDRRQFNILYVVFLSTFAICMICLGILGTLVTQNSIPNGAYDATTASPQHSLLSGFETSKIFARLHKFSNWFSDVDASAAKHEDIRKQLDEINELECIGWRQTQNCTPHGMRDPVGDKDCQSLIPIGSSGFCEVQNRRTKEIKHVMPLWCDSLREGVEISCAMFPKLMSFQLLSTEYVHDANFTYEQNQLDLLQENKLLTQPAPVGADGIRIGQLVGQLDTPISFDRAILMVIYERLLLGAFVSIRSLRHMGCTLPIEMWYRASETNVNHPLLRVLTSEYGVYLREIKDDRAISYYTKLHAIYYSAFDQVLLLDADNFATRDPNYLFQTPEFKETGAMFWPDFWKPGNTIFNVNEHSFAWEFFGLEFVDMFEQESGQVLIDRRRHKKAMDVLMYYGFTEPRLFDELRLVWGDKDLFRFAWMKSKSTFHYIQQPPGSAGKKHEEYDLFCGVTMVQHDPARNVIFMHRNTEKLVPENDRNVWTHIQQFKFDQDTKDYYVRGANGGKVFPQFKRCFGKDVHYEKLFTVKAMQEFPFPTMEDDLRRFMKEGAAILNITTTAVKDPGITKPDDPDPVE